MKPKIAFFINGLVIGGAEKDLRLLIETMKNHYDIHLILKIKDDAIAHIENTKVFYLTENESKSSLNFLMIPVYAWRYKRYLEKNNIPVSYSQLTRPNLTAAFTRVLGWKGVLILGEKSSPVGHYQAYGLQGKIILSFIKRLYKYADLIIPNSEGTRIALEETLHLKTRYEVIYNAINIDKTKEQGRGPLSIKLPKGADTERFTFICVSNLWAHKNQQLLIRAMQKVPHLDCQLWLVGVGTEEEKLRELVVECGQQNRVFILGYRSDALQLMSKADSFITATRAEGLPNAQIEAMTLGLPVISSDCLAGPRELLARHTDPHRRITTGIEIGECGILVAVNSLEALTLAMERMYSDDNLRATFKKAGPLSIDRFAYPTIMEKTVKSFEQFYS
jgi:N-acetylgalactosamine-N,N'-diacetylbacillosaminyl-diphospho-undecaprenol 4-alpha-N-acetylgalactosaminyltransferase